MRNEALVPYCPQRLHKPIEVRIRVLGAAVTDRHECVAGCRSSRLRRHAGQPRGYPGPAIADRLESAGADTASMLDARRIHRAWNAKAAKDGKAIQTTSLQKFPSATCANAGRLGAFAVPQKPCYGRKSMGSHGRDAHGQGVHRD